MKISLQKLWGPLVGLVLLASGTAVSGMETGKAMLFKQQSTRAYQHEFSRLFFVPHSSQIATLGMDDGPTDKPKFWDYGSAGKLSAVKTTWATTASAQRVAFNAAKSRMAVVWEPDQIAGQDYRAVEVYELPSRKKIHRMVVHLNRAESLARQKVAFSPDGNYLFFSAFSVRVWSTHDWKLSATLRADPTEKVALKREIIDFAISPDSSKIATLTQGSQVRLWNARTGRLLPDQQQPQGLISPEHYFNPTTLNDSRIEFAPDGKLLHVIINIITPRAAILEPSKYQWAGVAFYQWDVVRHQLDRVQQIKDFTFHSVAFHPQGKYLAMTGYHEVEEVSLWNLETLTRIQTLAKGEGAYYDVAISPDGQKIAAAEAAGKLLLWSQR